MTDVMSEYPRDTYTTYVFIRVESGEINLADQIKYARLSLSHMIEIFPRDTTTDLSIGPIEYINDVPQEISYLFVDIPDSGVPLYGGRIPRNTKPLPGMRSNSISLTYNYIHAFEYEKNYYTEAERYRASDNYAIIEL